MRILRVVGVVLAVGAAVGGCGYVAATRPAPATTPAAPAPTASTPAASGPASDATALPRQDVAAGSDGLTVRYADRDGSVKTLRVEDFRR